MKEFDYKNAANYYDLDYWDAPGKKSGYTNMTGAIGGDWHKQACGWFNSVIPVKDQVLLDAGCGLGHFMIGFKELGATVMGSDICEFCCNFVSGQLNLPCVLAPLEDLIMLAPDTFDIVFCSSVLEHIPQEFIEPSLLHLLRVTKPGGLLYLEADTKPDAEREMPEDSHVNIRPWAEWLIELDRPIYAWRHIPEIDAKLRDTSAFPGFPHPDWCFGVFMKC